MRQGRKQEGGERSKGVNKEWSKSEGANKREEAKQLDKNKSKEKNRTEAARKLHGILWRDKRERNYEKVRLQAPTTLLFLLQSRLRTKQTTQLKQESQKERIFTEPGKELAKLTASYWGRQTEPHTVNLVPNNTTMEKAGFIKVKRAWTKQSLSN